MGCQAPLGIPVVFRTKAGAGFSGHRCAVTAALPPLRGQVGAGESGDVTHSTEALA